MQSPFSWQTLFMHLEAYLRSAAAILNDYKGKMPFAGWLKEYFKQHKKFGSRDRRMVADLCFCYYRLGGLSKHFSTEEALLAGQFLCKEQSVFITELKPEWAATAANACADKLTFLGLHATAIFPHLNEISSQIHHEEFSLSHLVQPDLFLRIRPNKKDAVLQKLQQQEISFTLEENCLRLNISTKVNELLVLDDEAVIQDRSSQHTLDDLFTVSLPDRFVAWDCCAASGGKSILLHDKFPRTQLVVSDVRESILANLRNRFRRAGIANYQWFVADITSAYFTYPKSPVDLVVCDAPCSGSGTWGRTPEQLTFFSKEKIGYYAQLQKNIALTAAKALKKGGYFLYITCSVFTAENEEVVNYLLNNSTMTLVNQSYQKGYTAKGDSLFSALFTI